MRIDFEEDIKQCITVLRNGGTILYPTDTIWGIGCDATNEKAVRRIFEIKQRADSKSLILLADSAARISAYVEEIPEIAYDLIEIADKPLTIIYPDARNLAESTVAADNSVGFRVPKDDFCQKLCATFGKPIVSTSANISGENSPACFAEVSENIIKSVDYVVQFRQSDKAPYVPSSIIKLNKNAEFQIIRK
ncbi:MAG: L-threonylcarbamoyladenylate synthase [Paludibacter sp.]|nr:L-threonylcarbamoyladenylate synthase [Paludibacter sp.]